MNWKLVGLLTVLVVETHAPSSADACGVKLTIKSSAPRKAVARTSNPSEVLLLGTPPQRLQRDLTAAGHHVEVAQTPATAKRKSYAIVVADSGQQDEARSRFTGSTVVVRSGDVGADIRSVENQVARKPVRAEESREVLAAREARKPIAAGPAVDPNRKVVAAREPGETVVEPTPKPAVVEPRPAVVEPRPAAVEPKPAVVEPKPAVAVVQPKPHVDAPDPKPKTVARAKVGTMDEVYFTLGNAESSNASIAKAVRWLTDNASVQVVVEGHADPTGSPDTNMALAQKRAEWVRDQLVAAGIDASRLEVVSFGDTRLKYGAADNRNRRVAIVSK